jgi:hypothetical protein
MLAKNGWVEDFTALWSHPNLSVYYIDGNSGDLILKRDGHWTQIDNYYGTITNEQELKDVLDTD